MTNLALIGAGRWGTNIIRTLEGIPSCQLRYVSTSPGETKKILSDDSIDGVLVATPGSTHAKIALPFVRKGLPVFIEKPMVTSLKDGEMLAKEAKKSGSQIFVGHIHLYNPAYLKVKELVGNSGDIRLLRFEGMNNGPYRDDMSALWDWAPHDVAMAIDLVGSMPVKVQAVAERVLRPRTKLYDGAFIRLEFPSKIVAEINVSWLSPEKKKSMTVMCGDNSIVFDDTKPENKIALYKGMGPVVEGKNVELQSCIPSYPKYTNQSPLEAELRAFVSMIMKQEIPVTDLQQGLVVTSVLDKAEQSIELDGRVIAC